MLVLVENMVEILSEKIIISIYLFFANSGRNNCLVNIQQLF